MPLLFILTVAGIKEIIEDYVSMIMGKAVLRIKCLKKLPPNATCICATSVARNAILCLSEVWAIAEWQQDTLLPWKALNLTRISAAHWDRLSICIIDGEWGESRCRNTSFLPLQTCLFILWYRERRCGVLMETWPFCFVKATLTKQSASGKSCTNSLGYCS